MNNNINLIGISGRMGSGKNTVASIINQITNNKFEEKAFAFKLKQIASILTGIEVSKFEDQEFKKTLLGEEWTTHTFYEDGSPRMYQNMSVRLLLQKLGTEAMRDNLHQDVWANALFSDYKPYCTPKDAFNKDLPYWLITDLRFPNEFEAIKNRGGICIRVIRGVEKTPNPNLHHISETSLDNYAFNYIIYNNGTIEELIEKVRKMLQYFKII